MFQEFCQIFSGVRKPGVNSDTLISKLVYQFLLCYLVFCCLFVTFLAKNNGKMFCYTDDPSKTAYAAEYCSSQGVYLYARATEEDAAKTKYKHSYPGVHGSQPVVKEIFPGIRPQPEEEPERLYDFFYVNSTVYYLLMAASCYIGRFYWRKSQGQLLLDIIGNLKHKKTTASANERNNERDNAQDIEDAARIRFESIGQHRWYLIKYIISQSLNCIVLVTHLFAITVVGGVEYWLHGWRIFYYISLPYDTWPHEVAKEFPMVAKCDLKHYGPGGNEQLVSGLCFMHFNNSVQLVFAIHWIFATVLLVASLISTYQYFNKQTDQIFWANKLRPLLYQSTRSPSNQILSRLTPGTSFVVMLLTKNLSPHIVVSILADFRLELNVRGNEYANRLNGLL